jgi:cation diffusion facilitator CzcD-associated flavoprotein CzcO
VLLGSHKNNENPETQVAIIGAGPSGLLLGQWLHNAGIDPSFSNVRARTMCSGESAPGP